MKLQRNPTTKKINRDTTNKKAVCSPSGSSCCCGCACGAQCIKVVVSGTWIDAAHTVANPFVGTWYVPFNNKPSPLVGICVFGFACTIDMTVDSIHYIGADFNIQYGQQGGYNAIYAFHSWLVVDPSGTYELPRIGSFTPQPNAPVLATSSGCASIVTWTPATQGYVGIGAPYDSALTITFEVVAESVCTLNECEPTGCLSNCCPDATCVQGTITADFTSGILGTDIGEVVLAFSAGLSDSISSTSCFTYVECTSVQVIDGVTWTTIWDVNPLHHYCDSDGNLIWKFSGSWSYVSNDGHAYYASFDMDALQIQSPFACGDEVTGTFIVTDLTPGATYGTEVGTGSITFAIKEMCDDNTDCGFTTPVCPTDCFDCGGDCGVRCWTGAVLNLNWNLSTGECGVCSSDPFTGDGCGHCCKCDVICAEAANCPNAPCVIGVDPGCASCPCHSAANATECAAYASTGYSWYCDPVCIANGFGSPGDAVSTCSRVDYSGGLSLDFAGITGDEIHFGGTLVFGSDTVIFNLWFDCTDARWYARIIINGHCRFEGSINAGCTSFTTIVLEGQDTDITGSNCVILTGTLTDGAVTFAVYTCP